MAVGRESFQDIDTAVPAWVSDCALPSITCLTQAMEQREKFPFLSRNEDFWRLYQSALQAEQEIPESVDFPEINEQNWLEATRLVFLRNRTLQENVQAHRRHLSGSRNLLDKMLATAALGWANRALGVYLQTTAPANWHLPVDALLQPLSREERSLRRALQGELHYQQSYINRPCGTGRSTRWVCAFSASFHSPWRATQLISV